MDLKAQGVSGKVKKVFFVSRKLVLQSSYEVDSFGTFLEYEKTRANSNK